jgi:hypothetical protein
MPAHDMHAHKIPAYYVGDFSSLREAGLKGWGGLIGRDAAKIARFTLVKRA